MDYDLALELKNAGFPQYGKGAWILPPDSLVGRRADRVYVPTLEELIEACGERFTSLDQIFKPKEANRTRQFGALTVWNEAPPLPKP